MTDTATRILVATDFGPHSDAAVDYAADLTRRLNATLEVVHVVDDPLLSGAWSSEVVVPNLQEVIDQLVVNAKARLTVVTGRLAVTGLSATAAVVAGIPAAAIVDHARAGKFDLIVMGTHGRTGFSHLVIGSVAERVLRTAPCAVLTVKADGQKPPATESVRGVVVV